jgi:uncharacterized protein (TIGR01777 family)
MHSLITGGTGFIGSALLPFLQQQGHTITLLAHYTHKAPVEVRVVRSLAEIKDDEPIDTIINLAGAPIAKRWTSAYKKRLINSRVDTTHNLIKLIKRLAEKPDLLISASAIGYYGDQGTTLVDEQSSPHEEFSHWLCHQWETAAQVAEDYGVRTCIIRLGVVLGKQGGALEKMLPAFKMGLGGKLGTGHQFMSWVHIADVIRAFDWLINKSELDGVFNLTAPNPVTNAEFTAVLGKLIKRPTFCTMPALAVKLLFGEMGERLLLRGQQVIPKRLQQAGFDFTYPTLDKALEQIVVR